MPHLGWYEKMFDMFKYKKRAGVELRVKESVVGGIAREVRKPEHPGTQSHSKDSDFKYNMKTLERLAFASGWDRVS